MQFKDYVPNRNEFTTSYRHICFLWCLGPVSTDIFVLLNIKVLFCFFFLLDGEINVIDSFDFFFKKHAS
jgi:hypothetical protein